MTRLPHCCRPADSGRPFPAQRVCQLSVTAVLARDPRRRRHDLQRRLPGGHRARGRRQKLPNLLAAGRNVERIGSTATAGMRRECRQRHRSARGNRSGDTAPGPPTGASGGICATTRRIGPAATMGGRGGSSAGGRKCACARGRAAPGNRRRCPAGAGARWSRRRCGDPTIPEYVTVPGTGVTNGRRL